MGVQGAECTIIVLPHSLSLTRVKVLCIAQVAPPKLWHSSAVWSENGSQQPGFSNLGAPCGSQTSKYVDDDDDVQW